jgi:hypothetical protein
MQANIYIMEVQEEERERTRKMWLKTIQNGEEIGHPDSGSLKYHK